jgi:hypothetical protein
MRIRQIIASGAMLASGAAMAATAPDFSWGKPGVSFTQYRADAVDCGRAAVNRDIANTDAGKAIATGSKRLDALFEDAETATQAGDSDAAANYYARQARTAEALHLDARVAEIRTMLADTLSRCLVAKGYHRFRLTAEQRKHLARLRHGSAERHDYLYRLASDPAVQAAQAI